MFTINRHNSFLRHVKLLRFGHILLTGSDVVVDGLGFIMEMVHVLTFMAKGHLEHCLWPFIIVNWKAFSFTPTSH